MPHLDSQNRMRRCGIAAKVAAATHPSVTPSECAYLVITSGFDSSPTHASLPSDFLAMVGAGGAALAVTHTQQTSSRCEVKMLLCSASRLERRFENGAVRWFLEIGFVRFWK